MPGQVELSLHVEWNIDLLESTRALTYGGNKMHLRITGELGRGTFGVVYSVEDRTSGKQYALKKLVMDGRGAHDDERIERFRSEAYATARIGHPSILRIHRDDERNLYLLMELLEGGDLSHRRLDWGEALRVTGQVAGALSAAHELGIVHRDVKPSNIMLRGDGSPVLTDFGIAHLPESTRTLSQQILGTLEYLPPEAFTGHPPVPNWDVFALGVTVYELLDGRRPYPSGRTENGIPAFPDVRPVAPVCPDLPGPATELLLAMVHPDGAERPTAAVVADQLRGLLA